MDTQKPNLFYVYAKTSFTRGNKNPAVDLIFDVIIDDLNDKDIVDANSFFTSLFNFQSEVIEAAIEQNATISYIELLTIPAIVDTATQEPEWMQKKRIYYFNDLKIDDSIPENHNNNKSRLAFYLTLKPRGNWHKFFSLNAILLYYKENFGQIHLYGCNVFKQIVAVVHYNELTDTLETYKYNTVPKLNLFEKAKAYFLNSYWVDKAIFYYSMPAQIINSFIFAGERLILVFKKKITFWELTNVTVNIDLKFKLKMLAYSTILYIIIAIKLLSK